MRKLLVAAAACVLFIAPRARADEYDDALALHARAQSVNMRDREIAQFDLAVKLHDMGLKTPSYGLFYEISHHRAHARYRETLPWLARIAFELGEPAQVVESIGYYDEATVDAVVDEETRSALEYLRGRYEYVNHHYDAALRSFAKVDKRSTFYARAQIQSGMAHVLMRRTSDALRSFQRVTH